MRRYVTIQSFAFLLCLFATAPATAFEALYFACASCHGEAGQGNAAKFAPALAGLEADYIERQMLAFKSGQRGVSGDVHGQNMALIAKAYSTEQIKSLANIIAGFPALISSQTISSPLYAPCASCHGEAAQGNPDMGAPALSQFDASYLARQLNLFREQKRGRGDPWGQSMISAMADKVWSDDEIETLAKLLSQDN